VKLVSVLKYYRIDHMTTHSGHQKIEAVAVVFVMLLDFFIKNSQRKLNERKRKLSIKQQIFIYKTAVYI